MNADLEILSPVRVPARLSEEMRAMLDHLRHEIDHVDERDDRGASLAIACRNFAEMELVFRRPKMFAEIAPATEILEDQSFFASCAGGQK